MIKNAEDAGITVNFYDSNIGRSAGSATTSTYKLENVEAKDVTIERPAVEITSNNADFEKVMDPTLAVRYVSASSALADGFTYRFTDPTVLNAKFDNEQTYVKLSLVDGKLVRSGSLVPSRTIVVEKNTYALVRSADYSTPVIHQVHLVTHQANQNSQVSQSSQASQNILLSQSSHLIMAIQQARMLKQKLSLRISLLM